ncbi:hypothetical protein AB4144_01905, partial [Rhizobiaceae sp. 2RAB30]
FMHWRRRPSNDSAQHAFAHAMLVSSDNALVAIRMGAHTASPGSVYFAAGSFEPKDFPGGHSSTNFASIVLAMVSGIVGLLIRQTTERPSR